MVRISTANNSPALLLVSLLAACAAPRTSAPPAAEPVHRGEAAPNPGAPGPAQPGATGDDALLLARALDRRRPAAERLDLLKQLCSQPGPTQVEACEGWGGMARGFAAEEPYTRACQLGSGRGCWKVGGLQVFKDPPRRSEAVRWFRKAIALEGSGEDVFARGALEDIEGFRKGCDEGKAESCHRLAVDYGLREPVLDPEDRAEVVKALQVACEGGHRVACLDLANLYREGVGTDKDLGRALDLYRRQCQRKDPSACRLQEELDGLEERCRKQDPEACDALAQEYFRGRPTATDLARGRAGLQAGCEAGQARSCDSLGDSHLDPVSDLDAAQRAYTRAGELGWKGKNVEWATRFKADRGRCERGEADGCLLIAEVYLTQAERSPGSRDWAQGLLFARRACTLAPPTGCALAGASLLRTPGERSDRAEALGLLLQGCQQVPQMCLQAAVEGRADGTLEPAQSATLMEAACAADSAEACLKLAEGKEPQTAEPLLRKACNLGLPLACVRLED